MRVLSCQLIRSIRGTRSQESMARRIGCSRNTVSQWERGRRFPTAQEFCRVAQKLGLDPRKAFDNLLLGHSTSGTDGEELASWLDRVRGTRPLEPIAQSLDVTPSTLARWLRGKHSMRLPDFLSLLEVLTLRAADWVLALAPIDSLPALAAIRPWRATAAEIGVVPHTRILLCFIDTDVYRKSDGTAASIARELSFPVTVVDRELHNLMDRGVLGRNDTHYELSENTPETITAPNRRGAHGRDFLRLILERADTHGQGTLMASSTGTATEEDWQRIAAIAQNAMTEVRAVFARSEGEKTIAGTWSMQLVRWTGAESEE